MQPLVSVICLCYNHERFVRACVESVMKQTYPHLQVIVCDDASTDGSLAVILELKKVYPSLEVLSLEKNLGNCAAFNRALQLVKGEFVIDLATDDVMMPDRVQRQVDCFSEKGSDYGVVFTDAIYIDEQDRFLREHTGYLKQKKLITQVPEGDVFYDVISRYFIAAPTMMMRKSILDILQGYDEQLSYEDFDFWVRASRISYFAYLDEKLTAIRKLRSSMSAGWYVAGDRQLHSTYVICRKIQGMIRNERERKALIIRAQYEFRQAVFSHNRAEAKLFYDLLVELHAVGWRERLIHGIMRTHLPVSWLRLVYHRIRFS
jgi:glycosyltransferase involved in cell wall biosynthesis